VCLGLARRRLPLFFWVLETREQWKIESNLVLQLLNGVHFANSVIVAHRNSYVVECCEREKNTMVIAVFNVPSV
jgi:hypothetical protein